MDADPARDTVARWLEDVDRAMTPMFERALADDAVLGAASRAWRAWFAARAAVSPRLPDPLAMDVHRRGRVRGSGLGDEYPIDLFHALRAGWALAARSVGVPDLACAIEETAPPRLAPTPSRLALESGGFRVRRILPGQNDEAEPIVLFSPVVNRWYVLDLAAGESFVAALAEATGRPVYVVEPTLAAARTADRDDRSFEELCDGPLRAIVDHVRDAHGAERVALAGYSTGGVLAVLFAARHGDRVARLATICAPVRFRGEGAGAFARWLAPEHVDVELVAAAYDRVPAWLVHQPFWWLKPTIEIHKLAQLCRRFPEPGYVARFLAAETWSHDNVDFTRGVFRSWVGDLVQKDALATGADAARVACPLLVVSAEFDAIVPPRSAEALGSMVSSDWKKTLRLPTTHVGAVSSGKSLAAAMPLFAEWGGAS